MAETEINEGLVMQSLRAGSEEAYEMIFRSLYSPLCKYAFAFISDKDECEETVQNVFIQLWERRKDLVIESSLRAYMFRAVRNSCMNYLKHRVVRRDHASYVKSSAGISEGPLQHMKADELQGRITKALAALPEQCRLVFSLSRFEEMKYSEIADELGISIKTVENQMGKALRIMREHLQDYLPLALLFMKFFSNR